MRRQIPMEVAEAFIDDLFLVAGHVFDDLQTGRRRYVDPWNPGAEKFTIYHALRVFDDESAVAIKELADWTTQLANPAVPAEAEALAAAWRLLPYPEE